MLPEIGELVFSFVVGYMGALEFLYVVRHLYHWGFHHNPEMRDYKTEAASLRKLQEQLKTEIALAKEREAQGLKAMKDGVAYKDGFRIDEDRKRIEELKEQIRIQEMITERQKEIEAELEHQRKIEEETKKKLKQAEEELRRMEEEKEREKQKAEQEKRNAEEAKKRAEEEKRKAEEAKRKAEEEKRKAEDDERKRAEEEKQRAEQEEKLRKQRAEEEENMRKILEAEKRKEEEEKRREEEEENNRKLLQAEKEREEKQRIQEIEAKKKDIEEEHRRREEEEKENHRKLLEAERELQEKQRQQELEAEQKRIEEEQRRRQEEDENEFKLLQAEKEREEKQRQQEIEDEKVVQKLLEAERIRDKEEEEEKTRKFLEAERQLEIEKAEYEAALEKENRERLIAAEQEAILKQREQEEHEENVRKLLEAERELELKKQEMEEEAENLQRLIEAEKEMEDRQRKIDEEALLKLKNAQEEMELRQTFDPESEADEKAFIKREIGQAEQSVPPMQTVKTQYGQTISESLKPKALLFPGVSEESSSAEPVSSMQSSFSTQQSSEAVLPELHFDEYERQAPDGGEDMPSLQYSDDYLRSLDGIKNKPLVREDGSGRRRAFKKRRSSGSSTSSRESRASREEELKMFTSLEEEEFENIRKGDSEYETIKYASEPSLKVGKQHRRHKRSPAKDAKRDPNEKGSLQMLDEEDANPWGDVKPENYKNTEFWKREQNLSIDEEQEEFDAKEKIQPASTAAVNIPKMSSFEEATLSQHEEAISALQRQRSKDPEPIKEPDEESETKNVSKIADARQSPAGSNSASASATASASILSNSPEPKLEKSLETEATKTRTPSPTTGLRRSPRVDEMRQYEEKWKTDDEKARIDAGENPVIEIDYASDEEPMSPEHLPEGISDFYDFNASINPSRSRSRSRSRSKTPAVNRSVSLPERRTPSPLNYSQIPARSKSRSPSPDPASYKFIYQRIIPSLAADQAPPPEHGLSDFYDFNIKLNRETLTEAKKRNSHEVHRTSVDYILEDLRNDKLGVGGAIAKKIDKLRTTPTTPEYDRSISAEMRDIQKLKEKVMSGDFKRSTYVGESMDFSDQFESLREEAKHFRRSRSRSRSPVYDVDEMTARVLGNKMAQEKILEELQKRAENSEEFSKDLVDRNRRASDTALIQKPEILFQIQDLITETDENFDILDCEPEDYHHFRRFSLGQEIPVEEYPEDYTYISEIEIKSLSDLETLGRDLEYSPRIKDVLSELAALEGEKDDSNVAFDQNPRGDVVEESYESGSDDERQTVVEVDDEIDEDILDYNERPAEESHNEQSECEEADREIDRYADRNADDWLDVEGAVGGVSDEDSFQIDQIYDEAIKNRKPSGILRDFDSILKEIQVSDEDRLEDLLENSTFSNGNTSSGIDPGLWSPRSRSSRGSSRDSSRSFIEYEKRDNEMRYLADPTISAINSTRLRSRYGIVPSTSLPTGFEDDSIDVDLNYVPKKEYNWRKNFKLDDDLDGKKMENQTQVLDTRKFSLGGESIILFSQSPEHPGEDGDMKMIIETENEERLDEEMEQEPEEIEKPMKKKKTKRKSRKGSKGSIGENDEEKENISRKNSIEAEGDLQKKKSRRESKKATETLQEPVDQEGMHKQNEETEDSQAKKKSKKRRKVKDEIVLPKLDLNIPIPEKKAPPPSVAAIRAALSAPPPQPEVKSPASTFKPKKLWETTTSTSEKQSPIAQSKPSSSSFHFPASPNPSITSAPIPSTVRSSVNPQPLSVTAVTANIKPDFLPPKISESSSLKISESSSLQTANSKTEIHDSTKIIQEKQKTVITESVGVVLISKTQTPEAKILESSESSREVNKNSKPIESVTDVGPVNKTNQNKESKVPKLELVKKTAINVNTATQIYQIQEPEVRKEKLPNSISAPSTQNSISMPEINHGPKDPVPTVSASDIIKDGGLYPLCKVSPTKQTQSQSTPESDILKDGGLYPLF